MRLLMAVAITAWTLTNMGHAQASTGWIEPNLGQVASEYDFVVRASDMTAIVAPDHLDLLLPAATQDKTATPALATGDVPEPGALRHVNVRLDLIGARHDAATHEVAAGSGGVSHYYRGAQAQHWVNGVPHLARAGYAAVYPGIDVVYRINDGQLEYDFELEPGADPAQIRMRLHGAGDLRIGDDGALTASVGRGQLRHNAPQVFRLRDGLRERIDGAFVTHADQTVGFTVANTTGADRVIIDPIIEFSGFIGGSAGEVGSLMRPTADGDYVLAGRTASLDLPGAATGSASGLQDVFVTRIDGTTGDVEWVAYVGGTGDDNGENMAIDSQGNVVVVGFTDSTDYPAVNAFQSVFAGSENELSGFHWDATVFKLSPDGAILIFSTYLGGTDLYRVTPEYAVGFEWARGVTIDANDEILVAGQTAAPDFPVTATFQGRDCMSTDFNAFVSFVSDVFVARFATDGTLLDSVCLGGSERDGGRDVQLGPDGSVYIGGFGRSDDLPGTTGAYQPLPFQPLTYSPFVIKLSADLTNVNYASYAGEGLMQRIAVAANGAVFGSGTTYTDSYPVTPGAFQTVFGGGDPTFDAVSDAFVFKLAPGGAALEYATYLGGSRDDELSAMEIDSDGRVYIAGSTFSPDFPLQDPLFADIGPGFGDVETVSSVSSVQGLAISDGFQPPYSQAHIFIARDGLNQWRNVSDPAGTFSQTIFGETADSRDAVLFDSDSFDGPESVLFVNRFAPQHTYFYDFGVEQYVRGPDVGTPTGDSRAAAVLLSTGGFFSDVVVANYGGANELTVGLAPPVLIGRTDGDTTSVAVGSFGVSPVNQSVVFGNEFQDVRLLPYLGGSVGAPIIISAAGSPVTSLAAGDLNGDGVDELVIGNAGTQNQIVTFSGGVPAAPVDIGSENDDTRSLLLVDAEPDGDLDLLVGNAGGDRLYVNDGSGNLVLDGRYDGDSRITRALEHDSNNTFFVSPYLANSIGLRTINPARRAAVAAVLDPTGSSLEFSTYLEAGGDEYVFRGLTVPSTGRMLITGSTTASAWPRVGRDAPYAGQGDAMFMVINLDQDTDRVFDGQDNCTLAGNPDQRDTDGDGIGNRCDADLNNDCVINATDLGAIKLVFFSADPNADLNGDGNVNAADLGILKTQFFGAPGPSGLPNICN